MKKVTKLQLEDLKVKSFKTINSSVVIGGNSEEDSSGHLDTEL